MGISPDGRDSTLVQAAASVSVACAWEHRQVILFIAVGIVVVIGLAAAIALGFAGGMSVQSAAPTSSVGGHPLPEGPVTSDALSRVRFERALRGYRMDQVDAVMDRLYQRLAELESEQATARISPPWYPAQDMDAPSDDPDPGSSTSW